jgi:hypothetical protein
MSTMHRSNSPLYSGYPISIISIAYILILNILSFSCKAQPHGEDKSANVRYDASACVGHYHRDSLAFCFATLAYSESGIGILSAPRSDLMNVWADTVTYSSDCLRCVALMVIQYRDITTYDYVSGKTDGYYYGGGALIGLRQNVNELWSIYPFEIYAYGSGSSQKMASDKLRAYYFDEIVYDGMNVAVDSQNIAGFKYKFAVNDGRFWDSSVVWAKNIFFPNLYNFQVGGNRLKPGAGEELVLPHIDYPDSILQMFPRH